MKPRTPAQTRAANQRQRETIRVAYQQPPKPAAGFFRSSLSNRMYGYLDESGRTAALRMMQNDDDLTISFLLLEKK